MLLFVIVILTVASMALRIAIGSLDVAFYVAEKANNIRKTSEGLAVSASRHVGTKTYKTVKGTKVAVDTGFAVVGKIANTAKPVVKMAMRSTLKILKFITSSLRNVFIALEGLFLILDVVVFVVLLVASAGFISLYSTTDENGNIVLNSELALVQYDGNSSSESVEGSSPNFKKYDLSTEEVKKIANLCYQEQGSEKGAAAEASLMCNLYESSRGSSYDSVYDYVRNSGWFANAAKHMDNGNAPDGVVSIVSNVIVKGFRTLPAYVDEHDCLSDISKATNNGKTINVNNRSSYKQHTTEISNKYGSNYTFYCFPDTNSDPFGYTSKEERERLGDNCYSFEEAKNGKANSSTSGSGGKFALQCSNPDPNYQGAKWEVEDRDLLELAVTREYGADYEGSILVAQTIRDIMMKENTHRFADVYKKYGFDAKLPSQTLPNAVNACKYVFDDGNSGVQHKLMCFYARDMMYSEWHEAQEFVIQHKNVRFFDFD